MAAVQDEAQIGEKRRHSTRLRRESTAKRQAVEPEPMPEKPKEPPKHRGPGRPRKDDKSRPAKPRKSLPEIETIDPPTPRPQVLPTKIQDLECLPTLDHFQKDVGDQYQSIKDSKVLAAALARSRKRWIADGVFDKYWTKPPPRKRGDTAPKERGKPGDKVGTCTLTVEPHIFDVTLYAVKESLPPNHPQYHQYVIHQHPQPHPPNRPSNPPHPPQQFGHHQRPSPAPLIRTPSASAAPTTTPPPPPPQPPPAQQPSQPAQQHSQSTQQQSQPDPVIQMLAQRASTNPELKSIMKIVATGAANQQQLDYFQRHIDELTKIAKKQQEPKKPPAPAYHQGGFQHQPYHPPPRPVQAAPPPSIRINALLIEFALDTTSRFLFPANSILEYGPGFRSCTASFLIKRKVSGADDVEHYRECAVALHRLAGTSVGQIALDDMVFWQPVTVRFATDNGSMLEILARVVKPPAEVKVWMERMLNGEPDEPVKAETASSSSQAAAVNGGIKQEQSNGNSTSGTKTKSQYPQGSLRADSRKLAIRLPKEDRGKENEG